MVCDLNRLLTYLLFSILCTLFPASSSGKNTVKDGLNHCLSVKNKIESVVPPRDHQTQLKSRCAQNSYNTCNFYLFSTDSFQSDMVLIFSAIPEMMSLRFAMSEISQHDFKLPDDLINFRLFAHLIPYYTHSWRFFKNLENWLPVANHLKPGSIGWIIIC